jgi:hypothetical protein
MTLVGRAVVTESLAVQRTSALNDLVGVDQDAFDRAVDDTFGPLPKERVQQPGDGGN